jgi:hypothetical protein
MAIGIDILSHVCFWVSGFMFGVVAGRRGWFRPHHEGET